MTRLYLATFLVLSLISVSHAANFFGSLWKTVADKVHIPSSNIALPLIQCLKDKGAHELDTTFKAMTAEFPDGLEMYSNFKHAVEQFVEEANSINFNEGVSLDKRGLNRNKFVEVVLLEVEKAVQSLMNEFTLSLPESREKWLKNVDDSVSKILADLEVGLVTVLNPLGVQETVVREALDRIKPHIKNIVHVAADLIHRHPQLAGIMISVGISSIVVTLDIPILPFLLEYIMGSGHLTSLIAMVQHLFDGAKVNSPSLFSVLQRIAAKL